jgi:hypothetical protein
MDGMGGEFTGGLAWNEMGGDNSSRGGGDAEGLREGGIQLAGETCNDKPRIPRAKSR